MNYSIYIIKNFINNKLYIGRTYKNVHHRFREHLTSIHRAKNGCRKLVNAIKKYGAHNFYVQFICCTENENYSFKLEELFITYFNAVSKGYNLLSGGKQFRHTEETKQLISKSMKGKNAGQLNPFYGKIHTPESRNKISQSNMGHIGYALGRRIHTAKSKQKIANANRGENNFQTKLTDDDVKNIKIHLSKGGRQIEMVRKYNVSKSLISNIANGKTWSHISI